MDLSSFNNKYPNLNLQKMLSFIEGTLPESEARNIEQQIQEDPLTAQAITELEKFYYFNADAKEKALHYKDSFENAIDGLPVESPAKTAAIKKIGIIAAVAAALILIMFYVIWSDSEIQTNHYAQYFEPYPVINNMRSDSKAPGLYEEGIINYENKNFKAAIAVLENVPPGDENYESAQFYLAQSYMAANDSEAAFHILSDFIENSGSLFQSHAKWYIALLYLKQEKEKEAKAILKNIAQNEQAYKYGSAKSLLKELD